MNVRELAVNMLDEVELKGKLCHRVQQETLSAFPALPANDRAFLIRLFHGTLERQETIDRLLLIRTGRETKKQKPKLRNILRTAVYQLLFMEVPDSAAVNEAVELTKKRGLGGLSGMVNGVLRALSREKTKAGGTNDLLRGLSETLPPSERTAFLYSLPLWLVRYWEEQYDRETVEKMAASFLTEGRTVIRLREGDPEGAGLRGAFSENTGILPALFAENARILRNPGALDRNEYFLKGAFAIQDESSILTGNIAPLKAGDVVIDLCAAPGGKTCHLADRLTALGGGTVYAGDKDPKKLPQISENAERLGLRNVRTEVWDAEKFNPEFAGKADLVLADLPCSGLGVIGRKPDIKRKTVREDITALAEIGQRILTNAAAYVKPGGYLLFSTCTVTEEENAGGCRRLTELGLSPVDLTDRLPAALKGEPGVREGRLQLLPGLHGTDGFFISLFQKPVDRVNREG